MIKDLDFECHEKLWENFEPESNYYLQSQLLHTFSVTLDKLFIYLMPHFWHLLIEDNNVVTPKQLV